MPYYMGDFYQGDYYGGDPFWGALWTLGKRAVGAGRRVVSAVRGAPAAAGAATTGIVRTGGAMVRRAGGEVVQVAVKHPVLTAAAASGTIGVVGGTAVGTAVGRRAAPALPAAGIRGFHVSRKTGRVVRNRRMRVTNPRALRRAIRRAQGFSRLAMRVLRFTSPKRHGRPYFKPRRRAKRI